MKCVIEVLFIPSLLYFRTCVHCRISHTHENISRQNLLCPSHREILSGGGRFPKEGEAVLLWHTILPARSSVLYLCSAADGKDGCRLMDSPTFPNAGQKGIVRAQMPSVLQKLSARERRQNEKNVCRRTAHVFGFLATAEQRYIKKPPVITTSLTVSFQH